MTGKLQDQMRREANRVMAAKSFTRIGKVTNYDPENYCIQADIQPEGMTTGWIPLLTPWAGAGFGVVCPPANGTAVDVHFQEGSKSAGYASLRFFSQAVKPPPGCPVGEMWIVLPDGSYMKFKAGGVIDVQCSQFLINGIDHVTHVHGGVMPGGGETSGPEEG